MATPFGSFNPIIDKALKLGLIEIVPDLNTYVKKETEVQRSMRERLLSLPWRPLKRNKTVVLKEPAMLSYEESRSGKLMFVYHPDLWEMLKRGLQLSRFV